MDFKQGIHGRFTIHKKGDKPTEKEMDIIINRVYSICCREDNIVACIIGLEKGEEGRWHGQGYMRFNKKTKLTVLRKQVNDVIDMPNVEVHYCKADATPQANRKYCMKEGNVIEFGEFPDKGQGRREDIEMLKKDVIKWGGTPNAMYKLFLEHTGPMLKYPNAVQLFLNLVAKNVRRERGYVKPVVKIYWGGTGLGKSRKASWVAKELGMDVFYKDSSKWYFGYDGEKALIFEEFNGSMCTPEDFLRLCDGYPVSGETKGGHRILAAGAHMWFTSNTNPDKWWPGSREKRPEWDGWKAIRRRFTLVTEFKGTMEQGNAWKPPEQGKNLKRKRIEQVYTASIEKPALKRTKKLTEIEKHWLSGNNDSPSYDQNWDEDKNIMDRKY